MAVSQRDKQLWNAAQNSLADFSAIYDPKNKNPNQALTEYNRYKGIRNLSDLDAPTTSNNSKSSGGGGSTNSSISEGIGKVQSYSSKLDMGSSSDIIDLKSVIGESKEILSAFFGSGGGLVDGTKKLVGNIASKAWNEAVDITNKEKELRAQINSQLGIAGELSENYRQTILDSLPGVVSMGYGFEHVSDLMVGLAEKTGRFTTLNETVVAQTAITSRAFVGDLKEMAEVFSTFEQVGIGAEQTVDAINAAGTKSIALGLNGKKTVSDLRENIGKLNEYGFKNGVEGLTRMVQKATEFRMSLDSVLSISEKVMDPEQAISLSANMQVLGGAIGDFGDPLKMMYDATNNVEGLQDALIGAASSLTTYNSEQGRFEITGVNLRRAKAMAQELGISYKELSNGAVAAAERSSAASALMSRGLKLDDKQTEFITNLARMKDGTMTIDVSSISKEFGGAQSVALDQLTNAQVAILEKNQKQLEGMSVEEIARDQFTATQNLELRVSDILTLLKVQFAKAAGTSLKSVDNIINSASKYLDDAKKGTSGNKAGELIKAVNTEGLKGLVSSSSTVKKQESMNVDNKSKTTTTEEKTNTLGITKADLKEVMMDVHTSTKNDKNRPITINNNLEPTNPLDYLSYKI